MNKYKSVKLKLKKDIKLTDGMYIVWVEKMIPVGIHCFSYNNIYSVLVHYKPFIFGREKRYTVRLDNKKIKELKNKVMEAILIEGFMNTKKAFYN